MNELDQPNANLIDNYAKEMVESGAADYIVIMGRSFGKETLHKKLAEAVGKHRHRQLLPLLGDEQKEL